MDGGKSVASNSAPYQRPWSPMNGPPLHALLPGCGLFACTHAQKTVDYGVPGPCVDFAMFTTE